MELRDKKNTKLIILISSLLSICLVTIIAINAHRNLVQMSANNAELYSAYRISELMKNFRSNLNVLENKRKGYIITGDAKFLEAYKLKETETKGDLKKMERYFSGKPEEETFYKLKELTYKRLLTHKEPGNKPDLAGFTVNNEDIEGSNTINEIKIVTDEINESLGKTTKVLLDKSVEYVEASKKWSFTEVLFGIVVAIVALLIVFRDINVRTELERELRRAKQQADENVIIKEQFMANMSHEIRTPLNAIIGFSDLLHKTEINREQQEYLHAIKSSGSNLLNVINDILDFSKLEAGKLAIEKVPFNPHKVISDIKLMFEAKSAEKKISFLAELDKNIPPLLFGDANRLTQILVNLINNAVKFTEKGSVSLNCEIKSLEHEIIQLVFRVKDTGIGIPKDKVEQIFERFNQGNSDTTRKYGGTGLGLAIVKDLVQIQNGTIAVKSKEGAGSEFIVTLSYPVAFEEEPADHLQKRHLQKISNGHARVLLAEDNDLNQKLATKYLESFGLSVDVAPNGALALEKIKNQKYDLLLMDIQMPVMDGYYATEQIRNDLKNNIPIIAMTANSMEGEREKCLRHGMNDYISKPFKESELHHIVSKYIQTAALNEPDQASVSEADQAQPDLEGFRKLTRGNKKFMQEMIELFLARNPKDILELRTALQKKDSATLGDTAHRMKTSIGFMGLTSLLDPLNELELLGKKEVKLGNESDLVDRIDHHCEEARLVFQKELERIVKADHEH